MIIPPKAGTLCHFFLCGCCCFCYVLQDNVDDDGNNNDNIDEIKTGDLDRSLDGEIKEQLNSIKYKLEDWIVSLLLFEQIQCFQVEMKGEIISIHLI